MIMVATCARRPLCLPPAHRLNIVVSYYLFHNSPTKMTSSNKVPFPPTLNQSTMCSVWDNLRQLGRQNYTGCIAQGTGGPPWDRKGLYDLTWHGSAGYWYNGPMGNSDGNFPAEKAVGIDRASLFLLSLLVLGPAYSQSSRSP